MPIPIDTLWNIKRLNWVFALSSVALLAVVGWSIIQDYDKDWRKPQQAGRVWEAALVSEKIESTKENPDFEPELAKLRERETSAKADAAKASDKISALKKQVQDLESKRSTLEFKLNSKKSTVGVDESHLQDAITAGDSKAIQDLTVRLEGPRKEVADMTERMAKLKDEIERANADLKAQTKALDDVVRDRTKLTGDIELMQKKKESLQPESLVGKLSSKIRAMPLLQFMNPADKVQSIWLPDVLTDVAFMKITTVDRCMTCHVNIAKKDFSEDKVLAYLELELAKGRNLNLPETPLSPTTPATHDKPSATALPEFWSAWTSKLAPQLYSKGAAVFRRKNLPNDSLEKAKAQIAIDGKPLLPPDKFAKTDPASKLDDPTRDAVMVELVKAWAKYDPKSGAESSSPHVSVKLPPGLAENHPTRMVALQYIEGLKTSLVGGGTTPAVLDQKQIKSLLSRYRYALTNEVNVFRRRHKYSDLDPSPVQLAHPRLDLYVDVDSKHSFEAVGCTSCHDGSGQETDFVVAAHRARPIWVDAKSGEPILPQQLDASKLPPSHHKNDLSDMHAAVYPEGKAVPLGADSLHFGEHEKVEAEHSAIPATAFEAPEETHPVPYVDPITGKTASAISQMTYWVKTYEPNAPRGFELVYHEWDRPMLPPQFMQANCVRCHTDVFDIKDIAPTLYEGRALFTRVGCVNCHQMDSIPADQNRRVGTDLRHVSAKLSPAFINSWVWAPKAFRPSTKMPHFFMLENSSSDEEIRRTKQEARAITEYLVQTAEPLAPKHVLSPMMKGSPEAGKVIFTSIGCQGCHVNLNETGEAWITNDLMKAKGMKSEEAKEAYAKMTYNERQLYAKENLEAPEGVLPKLPAYADGSLRPVFVHHGPELSGIGTKLTSGRTVDQAKTWLFDWLKEPGHYSAYTMMPRLRLSDQQAIDLVEYLLSQKRTSKSPDDKYEAGLTPVDAEKLHEMTALFLRSRFSANKANEMAINDAEITRLATDALTTPIFDAKQAAEKVKRMDLPQKQMVFLGKKLIGHYGCMGCHAINGTETMSSPCANLSDWGQKGVDKLDFGYLDPHKAHSLPKTSKVPMVNGLSVEAAMLAHETPAHVSAPVDVAWPHVEHSRVDWIEHKLKNTRVWDRGKVLLDPAIENGKVVDPGRPYDKLKMPTFYLNDDEVHALVTFVISNRDRLVSEKLVNKAGAPENKTIARGRELVERFNCIGCHQVELNQPQVQQYYKSDEYMDKAPPMLRGEGNKTQHDWLFNFFKNVEPLRPLLAPGIRMPSFHASDEEWTAIIAYFNSISNKESIELKKLLDPIDKYMESARKSAPTTGPTTANGNAQTPGDDWYLNPSLVSVTRDLRDWALARKQINGVDVDATKNKPDALAKSYRTILFKARFTAQLYDSPFPFVDHPRPEVSDERFKTGEQFFHEMQCLSCHHLGDPAAAGATKDPKGPNLSLVHSRLQRRWSRHWVQEPPVIQPGTKMPQFFSGLPVFKIEGQDWASAVGLPPAEVDRTRNAYGATADEQNQLLWDFLYAAGVRNYASVQPAKPAATTAPAAEK